MKNIKMLVFFGLISTVALNQPLNAGWRDTISRLKNNQFVKSLTEVAIVTAINECVSLSINAATNGGYFFLREAFATMCAPTVAHNLQLTPKLLHKLANYPKTRDILSQLIKHTACVIIWASPSVITQGSSNPVGNIGIQYLTAELLVLALDMGLLTNPRSNTDTHPNSEKPKEAQAPLSLPSQPDNDIESDQFIKRKE